MLRHISRPVLLNNEQSMQDLLTKVNINDILQSGVTPCQEYPPPPRFFVFLWKKGPWGPPPKNIKKKKKFFFFKKKKKNILKNLKNSINKIFLFLKKFKKKKNGV